MEGNEKNHITCEHELVYHRKLKKGEESRFKREEEITLQAKNLAKKILKKRQNEFVDVVPEDSDSIHDKLPSITNSILVEQDEHSNISELVDKGSLNENQPLYPHSAFCQLSSSSSEVSEMSFDVSKYDEIKLPIIHQTKYHDTVEIINESIEPIAYDQTYPLTSKALLERTAYQRQQELLDNQNLRLELEKKMVSVLRLKECMKKTEASLGCHQYERNLRGQSDLQWEQLGLSQRVDVSRLGKHKEAILSKYRKLYKERDDNMKTRLQRKLKIVEKLLKEEKIKHGVKKIDEKRKSPKLVELKKVESEIIHDDLEEGIQIDEEQAEEHVVEEEEKVIVPLEIEPIVDTKKKRKSRREKHESKTSEDGIKSKEKKKDKGSKSKSPVKSAKKGKSKSKSRRSSSKSKKKSKKDKKKPKSREASAISEDFVEPEAPENQFPTLLKLFEEWEDKRKTYEDQMELLSVETGVEWKPDIITFKDFKPQSVYKQRLHIVNTSSQRLHFRLAAILMDDDLNCEVLKAGPVDAIKLGPGMSWTMDVKLFPVENTSEVTGNIKFITTHLDTTQRQFLVKFVATPCRAEPYIQPVKLIFPTSVFWSSLSATRVLKVINNGGLECRLTLRKVRNEDSVGSSNVYISSIEQEENIEDQNNYLGTEVHEGEIPVGEATYLSDDVTNIQGDDNNEQDELSSSDWESSPCLWFVKQITEEIFDDVFAVFRIQFRHFLYVPPHGEISIPVKFIPRFMPFVGKIYEKYEAIFEEENVVNSIQDILICGETEDIPIHISSPILDLKLCFLGGNVQQDSFRVYSTTKHVCALSIKVPPSLAKHIQVDPKEAIIQSYSSINFIVRLILKSDFYSYKYFDESTGILEFPIEIYISGLYSEHPPPLIVTVIALVTSCVLSLKPNYIDFGQVSTYETVTTELKVINYSKGIHEFSFINLPNSINIEPGGGSGKILPGETLSLQVLYSPSLNDMCLGSSCSIGSEGQHNFTLQCVTAIELANGLQRLSCLQQVKPISQSFSALNKVSLSDVEKLTLPGEFQHDSMTSLTVKAETVKNVFVSAESITTNSQKDEENPESGFIEESSTIQYDIDKTLATTDVPSLKQILDNIIEQSNPLEDSSLVWNLCNSFEIGNFTHEGNLELKDNSDFEENNLELNNEEETHTNVKSLQNSDSIEDQSELSRKIGVNLEEEKEMKDREFQEIIEVDEIEQSIENKSETMSVSTQHTTEFAGMFPVVHISAYIVDPLVELSAQKIIFPSTPCESFFISHIYLRSKKQEGCHCGRLKPNAHKFIARFEFKWKCDQISVEPRRGEIAMDQSIKISIVFKPKLRKSDILTKAKEIKTEKLYEEAIKAFVESQKNKPKKKKKGKQDNKKSKSGKKKSVAGSKLNKKEKQNSVKSKKSATENKAKDKRKSGGKLKEKVNDEKDNKKSRKSSKSEGKKSLKKIADSGDYTDIEEITLPDIVIDPDTISIDEEDIKAAETYLLKYYDPNTIKETISCLIETAILNQERRLEVLQCEVICPITPPNIVLQASHCLDFGPTAIGTNMTQTLPIINVAENTVPVIFTPLNPYGAFTCPVKHRRDSNVHIKERCKIELEPEHSLNLPVKFTPRTEEKERMNELFEIKSESTIINVMVRGRGVYPKFEFTPEFALYTLEAAPGKKVECKITITNSCESPLNFHLKQEFLKEGSNLPENKPVSVETSNKQGKQPKTKQKKEKFQKMRPTIDLDFIDWLNNEFQLVDEQNLINPVFDINDNFTVVPEGNYVLKITFCPPPHDIVKSSSPSIKSPRKSKGKSKTNEGATKDKKVKKLESISPRKGKKDRKSRKQSSKGKMETKHRIFAVKYVISLGRLIDVKEWIIIGIVKEK